MFNTSVRQVTQAPHTWTSVEQQTGLSPGWVSSCWFTTVILQYAFLSLHHLNPQFMFRMWSVLSGGKFSTVATVKGARLRRL